MEFVVAGAGTGSMHPGVGQNAATLGSPAGSMHTSPVPEVPGAVEQGSPDLDADVEDAPLKFRDLDDLLGPTTPPGFVTRDLTGELLVVVCDEPTSVEDALNIKQWCAAMTEELSSIKENDTWSLADEAR
jgi:hypothetical protein